MASASLSVDSGFEIDAEVRFSDSLIATLWPSRQRGVKVGACLAILAVGAWLGEDLYDWAFAVAVFLVASVHAAVACLVYLDYRNAGSKPKRIRYHICGSGFEASDASDRSEWIPWADLVQARETPCSFLLRPSDVEHYVIPKRCCQGDRAEHLREALRRCYVPARSLAGANPGP